MQNNVWRMEKGNSEGNADDKWEINNYYNYDDN